MTWVMLGLLVAGGFFLCVSSLGLLLLPDLYSRAHAAGKSETLGAILVLGGIALRLGFENTSAKILLMLVLVAMGNPTGIHALTRAALRSGHEIWSRTRQAESRQAELP